MSKVVKTRKTKASISDNLYNFSPLKKGSIVLTEAQQDKPLENYNKILSKIYLGNIKASKDESFFKTKKIKGILNCSKNIPNTFMAKKICKDVNSSKCNLEVYEYLRIPIDDSLKEIDFEKAFLMADLAADFIHKYADILKLPVFVHCYAGRQRSAQGVAMYLMKYHNMTPIEACKLILEKRPEAFHFGTSLNFESSINKYYKQITKK